jgi:predicted Fe-S protein YdhL (DUF1289 family)
VPEAEFSNTASEAIVEKEVASPCIKACKINTETNLCNGCLRTLDEIIVWSKASNSTKLAIWSRIEERKNSRV